MNFIFDLDLTIWDTFDKYHNQIWAKQLIPPYKIDGDVVTDDVFSTCTLRKGVREYIHHLVNEGHQIGFISVGAYYGLPFANQPSYNMLQLFDIYQYFDAPQLLKYKLYDKTETIKKVEDKIVFYDDSPKVLEALKPYNNVIAIDSTNIKDWSELIGKNYD
jgi:predicted phosphatase